MTALGDTLGDTGHECPSRIARETRIIVGDRENAE
jgi:hypothetical protein